jgi:signal transduction histidine kinase
LTQWIEEDFVGTLPPESAKHFELLKNRVQRMNDLVQGILEYARIGRVHVKLEDVNMQTLLKEVVDALGLAEGFTVMIAPNLPTLTAAIVPLSQVFSNLIGNAVKYHHQKQGKIMVTVKEYPNYYEFAVIDDGPGIAKEFHEKVFGLFQTLQARDKFESTGIGLTIVKKIIENQGGKIWIESEVGQGTQFHFTWIKILHDRRETDGAK